MLSKLIKLRNDMARNKKKGFTLVEMIVVLVILAILLAILVPSLIKWIDKAKEKQILIDARTAYLAAQTVVSEDYGEATPKYIDTTDWKITNEINFYKAVNQLAGVTGSVEGVELNTQGEITKMTYKDAGSNKSVSLDKNTWTINEPTESAP